MYVGIGVIPLFTTARPSIASTFKCQIIKGVSHMAQFQNQMISIIILDEDTFNSCGVECLQRLKGHAGNTDLSRCNLKSALICVLKITGKWNSVKSYI
jgi:hypothetical protein